MPGITYNASQDLIFDFSLCIIPYKNIGNYRLVYPKKELFEY